MHDKTITTQAIQAIQTSDSAGQSPEVQHMIASFSRMKENQGLQLQTVVLGLVQMLQSIGVTNVAETIRLFASSSHQQIMGYINALHDAPLNGCPDKFTVIASALAVSEAFDPQVILKAGRIQEGKTQFSDPKWATFVSERIVDSNREALNSSLGIIGF